jgi:phospholipase/carboxylesterase
MPRWRPGPRGTGSAIIRPVETLRLAIQHKTPEPREEASPTGQVRVENESSRALLMTPDRIDPERRYPLITVLHGAGRREEMLVKAYREEPEARDALFLIPRSYHPTWDLIASDDRPDLDFLEWAYDLIYRRYPVDTDRQGLVGYSDGASYALSVGLSNPGIFRAVMGWAAGFLVVDDAGLSAEDPKPAVLLEYGTQDPVFPFERVAIPMRAELERRGYSVNFRVDEGGKHWPSGEFQREALDWFFSELPGL